ncbi:MAG TPA: heme o synthase [Candidatus Polarisedimenticolaceae bacterium]|nr:heme o synthase [Candidatus Polarisedimenticolaceae bacterium]
MSPNPSETSAPTPWIAGIAATGRDLLEIGKPRITTMVVFTAAIGVWLAPGSIGAARVVLLLLGTAMLVASANMLNSWYERETDALMVRTRNRPIPAGRLDAWSGFAAGLGLGAFAIPILALAINPLTALLGMIAHATYVWAYTPLKRVTPLALEVGAIPGAIPPLMGWTAGTGALAVPGWFLFGILFFWQLPHFLAIAIYLEEDYRRGGLDVLTVRRGALAASRRIALYTVALVVLSLLAQPLGIAGTVYTAAAAIFGAGFLILALRGVTGTIEGAWARRTMLYSIVWLTAVLAALVLDAR